jgi:hypothetical protein
VNGKAEYVNYLVVSDNVFLSGCSYDQAICIFLSVCLYMYVSYVSISACNLNFLPVLVLYVRIFLPVRVYLDDFPRAGIPESFCNTCVQETYLNVSIRNCISYQPACD